MEYAHSLYWEDNLEKKKEKVIDKVSRHKFMIDVYLVVLSAGETKHLEIINSLYLMQQDYPDRERFVVGIAGSYEGAVNIVQKIVEETYESTKGTDIVKYILDKEQEE